MSCLKARPTSLESFSATCYSNPENAKEETNAKTNGTARAHRDDHSWIRDGSVGRQQNATRASASEARISVRGRAGTKGRRRHHRTIRSGHGLAEAFDFAART